VWVGGLVRQDFVHSIDCVLGYCLVVIIACDGDGDGDGLEWSTIIVCHGDGLEWSAMGGCHNEQ
jgi:hypothetical protein